MKLKSSLYLSAFILLLSVASCNIINPDEPIPAYIQIDAISLQTNETQGTSSSKIVDAWVYIDEKTIGAFELPATIPVLSEGAHEIKIIPGVMLNGIAATRAVYPFYKTIISQIELTPGEVNNTFASITTTYNDDVVFPFDYEENFESGGTIFEKVGDSDTVMTRSTDSEHLMPVYGGNACGAIYMDENHDLFESATIEFYHIPQTNVFLEFNYRTNNHFSVGLMTGTGAFAELLFITPKSEWNKIYFNLTPYIADNNYTSSFKIYFNADLDFENEEALILLDNIKLLYK